MAKTRALDKLKEKTADLKPTVFIQQAYIKDNLLVLPELKNLIPPLREDEYQQLESNLLANGIKDPLTIWETTVATVAEGLASDSSTHELLRDLDSGNKVYVLIDGHNRYDLASKHQLDYRINIIDFEDLETVRDYMINFQLGRRNLTPEQASYLRGLRYNKLKEANRTERINVAQQLAQEYKVSTRTIKRDSDYAKGMEGLSPELKKEVLAGKAKLPKAAAKALAKTEKPIETLTELNKVLVKKSRRVKSQDDETSAKTKSKPGEETSMPIVSVTALQQDLKSLMKKDLSQKEVLREIISKAQTLLQQLP